MLRPALVATATLVAALSGLAGPALAIEEPKHEVVLQEDDFELRRYAPIIVAEVTVTGDRGEASYRAFRPLADYIFGANLPGQEIAMTAPVTQERARDGARDGAKIAMTAPVTQEPAEPQGGAEAWRVRFTMPAEWTMDTLPRPKNPDIRLIEVPAETVAAVRFSGWWSDSSFAEERDALAAWIASKGWRPIGEPVYAYYNDPFTLPFLRRNEVLWRVEAPEAAQVR